MTSQPIARSPYLGLSAFREEDAPFFFGREFFTQQLVLATQQSSLVAVIGASGSGKSSVVFAGLIPHLRQQGNWQIASFRPGHNPFNALAYAIIPLLESQASETDLIVRARLADLLQHNPGLLRDAITDIVRKDINKRLLLVADQFEELYTLCFDIEERHRFLESLLEAVNHAQNFTLVLTLRADFFGDALSFRPFADALQTNPPHLLSPMNRQELKEAIQKPALIMGVEIESGLAERILDDVAGEPGSLPLLEFTLTQLWERQRNGLLTYVDYTQIGGVGLSLANHAENVYQQLNNADQQRAQRVFLQLIRPGEGTEDTRRRATLAEVGQENEDVIQRLATARLLIVTQELTSTEKTVEIAHEALIREWERLRQWINIDRSFRVWQERLRVSARQWKATGNDEGALLRGVPLAEAEDWLKQRSDELSRVEREFIELSLQLRKRIQREQTQSQRQEWLSVASTVIGLITAVVSLLLSLTPGTLTVNVILVFIAITTVLLIAYFVLSKLSLSIRNSSKRNVLTNNQDTSQFEQQIAQNTLLLERCTDVVNISTVYQRLTHSQMESAANLLIRSFSSISENVEVALNQGSAYNQRLAFKGVRDKLDALLQQLTSSSYKYPVLFRPIAHSWRQIISNYVEELTQETELRQEIDSPYIIGPPLTEEQKIFTGRTDIGLRIEQLLLDRRRPPLLLYGQRRMGKTSLLNNLGRLLPNTIIPMFVDLQGAPSSAKDSAGFLYNLARGMIKSAKKQGVNLPPLTREALTNDPFTCFDEWLDKFEQTLEQNTALLMLDEFEVLDSAISKGRFDEQDILGMLRNLIQHRPKFKVMIAGSHTIEEYQRWASYLINVQVVHISYLKEDEARQLIERPVKDFTLRYEPEASDRVLQLTRGHPFLVQLLCAEIVALKNEQDPSIRRLANLKDVEAAIPQAFSSGGFFFADIQNNQVDAIGLAILRFIAAQGEGATVSRKTILQQFPDVAENSLKLLLQRQLIEEVDESDRFAVELIRRWFANQS
jgi:energy-coupling factor transporter ATP-binding protein EcfA2